MHHCIDRKAGVYGSSWFLLVLGGNAVPVVYRMAVVLLGLAACTEVKPVSFPPSGYRVVETRWGLRKLFGANVDHRHLETVTIGFGADGHISGTASCNLVGGKGFQWVAYVGENGGDIAHDVTQPMIQTVVGCNDTRQTTVAEGFWHRMETANAWMLRAGKLTITFEDGGVAELVPIAAPATQLSAGDGNLQSGNFDRQ